MKQTPGAVIISDQAPEAIVNSEGKPGERCTADQVVEEAHVGGGGGASELDSTMPNTSAQNGSPNR